MLILLNTNHDKIEALTNYKDYYVEQAINIDDLLYFSYPIADPKYSQIAFECYISNGSNEYVIKEINIQGTKSDIEWAQFVCKINLEDLKGHTVESFETVDQLVEDAANLAVAGTGWAVAFSDVTTFRTVRKARCSVYDILIEITKAYNCEITYSAISKTVIIHQKQGADRGTYFAEQLNLTQLQAQGNSNDYITRLIPIGRDGLDITSANAGVNYVSNYQYSTKIITGYWVDNRYAVAQDLKDDATERLAYLSKPIRAYAASIIDLANVSPEWGILDFALGDFITLLSESYNVREQQRIVKIDRYPDEPERSTIQIANRIVSLEDIILRILDATSTVEATTDTTRAVMASSVTGPRLFVEPSEPVTAKIKDVWVDTDDYSRYDKVVLSVSTTLLVSDEEFIAAYGTIAITLHTAALEGIIKKIYNAGTGIVTIIGTINDKANMLLYPGESIELITDGSNWRC